MANKGKKAIRVQMRKELTRQKMRKRSTPDGMFTNNKQQEKAYDNDYAYASMCDYYDDE